MPRYSGLSAVSARGFPLLSNHPSLLSNNLNTLPQTFCLLASSFLHSPTKATSRGSPCRASCLLSTPKALTETQHYLLHCAGSCSLMSGAASSLLMTHKVTHKMGKNACMFQINSVPCGSLTIQFLIHGSGE